MIRNSRLRRLAGVSVLALAALSAGVSTAPSAIAQTSEQPLVIAAPNGAPMSFADLIERVSPAVVSINATVTAPMGAEGLPPNLENLPPQFREWMEREFGNRSPQQREGRSLGSGFFISAEGHIVTNNHVIANATEITIDLPGGGELPARVIGTDPLTDIALLQVTVDDGRSFPFVTLDDSPNIRVGDWVVAVGNPFGLGGTATAGIVSATGREIATTAYNDFIQIDAPINRGNSGGPTFDLRGNVIGVNSQIFSPSGGNVGIGFAIPSDVAANIVAQLLETGRVARGWLGVQIQDVTEDIAESLGLDERRGAIISSLVADGPAARGGLRRGDVVLAINGNDVENSGDLTRRVGAIAAGQPVNFRILRDGDEDTIRITLAERPDETTLNTLPGVGEEPEAARYFGMQLTPAEDGNGLVVESLDSGGEATMKGLRRGDVIVEAGGQEVNSVDDFAEAVEAAQGDGRSAILLLVQGANGQRYIALQLDAA